MSSLPKPVFQPDAPALAATVWMPRPLHDGSVEVSDVWRILWHRRRWIVGTLVLLVGATLLYGALTPSLYSATAQILVDPRDRQVVNNDVNPSTVAPDGGVAQVESQVAVIQSTGVLMRAIKATQLTDDPEFNGTDALARTIDVLARLFGDPAVATIDSREARTLTALRRSLSVKRADKVLVIDLAVTAKSAAKSARLANAIADAYLADQAAARAAAADAAADALSARLAEQRQRVREAENAVEQYRSQHSFVVATGQLVSERQLADVNDQLSAAQSRVAALKAKVDEIALQRRSGAAPAATSEAIQSPVIAKLREQESTLAQRAADLESQLGPRHPAIAAVRLELNRVHQLINAELDRVAKSVKSDYDRANANEASLAAKLASLKTQTLANDQASVRLLELQRERDAVRAVYANYLLRVQETREQANVDSTNSRIISRALVAQQRSWPPLFLLLAGAVLGGLGIGAALALIVEYISPTVLSFNQIQSITGAPVIGLLPSGGAAVRRAGRLGRARPGGAAYASGFGADDLSPRTQDMILMSLRRLAAMDAVRRDRTVVRSILLTSGISDAGERDRIAQLFAITASMRGERVLFVDADVAHDQQTATAGLLDVLRGECSLQSVLQFDPGGRLALVNKGRQKAPVRGNAERVFLARMLTEARDQFDLVVVEGGEAAENLKIAPLLEAVQDIVLVGELSATPQSDVAAATQMLRIAGREPTGVMLVDAQARA